MDYADGLYLTNGQEVTMEDLPNINHQNILCARMDEIEVGNFGGSETLDEVREHHGLSTKLDGPIIIEVQCSAADILVFQGLKTSFYLPLSQLTSVVQEKLAKKTQLLRTEFNCLVREFAKHIYTVEPSINVQKINLLAELLCVKFESLIDRDEDGEMRNNGYDTVALSLEQKISHMRRKSLPGPTSNLKQNLKTKDSVDNVFRTDIEKLEQLKLEYPLNGDKDQALHVLDQTFAYQRAKIQVCQKKGRGDCDTVKQIIDEWPFFTVSRQAA